MTLTQLQQEAREEILKAAFILLPSERFDAITLDGDSRGARQRLLDAADSITARVYAAALDSVESGMPGMKESFAKVPQGEWGNPNGWNSCRNQVLDHLRTIREGITGNV